jgi:hypothetical protein
MQLFHLIQQDALAKTLRSGLKHGSKGALSHNKQVAAANSYLDNLRPASLKAKGLSRANCLYLYYARGETVHDIEDGAGRPARQWATKHADMAALRVEVDPARAYVSDLDAFDAVLRAIAAKKSPAICQKLAEHYWQRVLVLQDFLQQYARRGNDFVRTRSAPTELPERYTRIEIMATQDIAPSALSVLRQPSQPKRVRPRQPKPIHYAADFGLDVLAGDDDLFRWFLLSFLFGKPIQSNVAARTWQLFIDRQLDTPWAIAGAHRRTLVRLLDEGKYTRYDEVTARALQICMQRLIDDYEGSLMLMYERSQSEDEFSQRLQELYGVGPKTAEIFMRETEELFARRAE